MAAQTDVELVGLVFLGFLLGFCRFLTLVGEQLLEVVVLTLGSAVSDVHCQQAQQRLEHGLVFCCLVFFL